MACSNYSITLASQSGTNSNTTLADNLSAFSISLWLKTTQNLTVLPLTKAAAYNDPGWYVQITGSVITFYITGTGNFVANGTTAINDGAWHNALCTWDGTTMHVYIDGMDVTSIVSSSPPGSFTNSSPVAINLLTDTDGPYNGKLDDIYIWGRVLDSSEASTLFSGGTPSSTNLLTHWAIEEGAGTILNDSSGNGNTITFNSSPTWTMDTPSELPSCGGIIFIQSVGNTQAPPSNPQIVSISGVTTGNTIIVGAANLLGLSGTPISGITDNMGNTYIKAAQITESGQLDSELWYAANVIGGNLTISIAYGDVPEGGTIYVLEFSGADIISPVYGANTASGTGAVVGPSLTNSDAADMLVTILTPGSFDETLNAPWTTITPVLVGNPIGYYTPGTTGTFNAVGSDSSSQDWSSAGLILRHSTVLTLSLSDSIELSDEETSALAIEISDSTNVTDAFPQSFTIQTDILLPVSTPVVETLVEQLLPAGTKVYFRIEE